MPKTTRKFDWEVYDEKGKFFDILSMTRNEAKEYQKAFPKYKLQEIMYTDDGNDDSREAKSNKTGNIYSIRIPK